MTIEANQKLGFAEASKIELNTVTIPYAIEVTRRPSTKKQAAPSEQQGDHDPVAQSPREAADRIGRMPEPAPGDPARRVRS